MIANILSEDCRATPYFMIGFGRMIRSRFFKFFFLRKQTFVVRQYHQREHLDWLTDTRRWYLFRVGLSVLHIVGMWFVDIC